MVSSVQVSGLVFHHELTAKKFTNLRWLRTVVTSHTASKRQAYTPVMSMLQKAVQSTHCTSCNQPAYTNAIMLYAVKLSLYVVGPFLCRILHKRWSTGVKMWQNCLVCQNEHGDIWIFFANPFLRFKSYLETKNYKICSSKSCQNCCLKASKSPFSHSLHTSTHARAVFALSATPTTPAHTDQLGRCK